MEDKNICPNCGYEKWVNWRECLTCCSENVLALEDDLKLFEKQLEERKIQLKVLQKELFKNFCAVHNAFYHETICPVCRSHCENCPNYFHFESGDCVPPYCKLTKEGSGKYGL